MKETAKVVLFVAAVGFVLLAVPPAQAQFDGDSEDTKPVSVTNFPDVQQVTGKVAVAGTVSHAKMVRFDRMVIPSQSRTSVGDSQEDGVLETDGFSAVTLSFQGRASENVFTPGVVGVVLVPDEEPVALALRDARQIQFPLEATVTLQPAGKGYFSSDPVRLPVAFPRYKLYTYNTTSTGIQANVYAYLTN